MIQTTFEPLQHQLDGLKELRKIENEGRGVLLADQMGLGKTVQTLLYLEKYKTGKPDIIVCPVGVIDSWVKTIEMIRGYPEPKDARKVLVYHGEGRQNQLAGDWDFIVTSYGCMGDSELRKYRYGRIVLDESHNIKNGCSTKPPKRARDAYVLRHNAEFGWCVTGTPFHNSVFDFAAQAKFIGTEPYNEPMWWKRNKDNEIQLHLWKKNCMLRRTKDEVENDLAKPIYHQVKITQTEEEAKLVETYRSQAQEQFQKWKASSGAEKSELTLKILGLIQRLRMISNSIYVQVPLEEIDTMRVLNECAKVNRMINDIDGQLCKDEKKGVVVYSEFTSFLIILKKVIEDQLVGVEVLEYNGEMSVKEKNEAVDQFNTSREPRVILVSLTSGGTGISLHHGSASVFIAEPYWNNFLIKQAQERVHRQGQTAQVEMFNYCTNNSVEMWVQAVADRKESEASMLALGDNKTDNYTFDELSNLFKEHVGYISRNKKKVEKREEKVKPVVMKPKEDIVEKWTRDAFSEDLYTRLGVALGASNTEIKSGYMARTLKLNPANGNTRTDGADAYKKLCEAFVGLMVV